MGTGDINLIAKIAPYNDGFTGMVDADQVIGMSSNARFDGQSYLPSSAISANSLYEYQLKTSNGPSNGYFLQYKDDTDELTWASNVASLSGPLAGNLGSDYTYGLSGLSYISSQKISGGTVLSYKHLVPSGGSISGQFGHIVFDRNQDNEPCVSLTSTRSVDLKGASNGYINFYNPSTWVAYVDLTDGEIRTKGDLTFVTDGYIGTSTDRKLLYMSTGSVIIDGSLSSQKIKTSNYISTQTGVYAHFISANNSNLSTGGGELKGDMVGNISGASYTYGLKDIDFVSSQTISSNKINSYSISTTNMHTTNIIGNSIYFKTGNTQVMKISTSNGMVELMGHNTTNKSFRIRANSDENLPYIYINGADSSDEFGGDIILSVKDNSQIRFYDCASNYLVFSSNNANTSAVMKERRSNSDFHIKTYSDANPLYLNDIVSDYGGFRNLSYVSSQKISGGTIRGTTLTTSNYVSSQGIYAHFVSANNTNLTTDSANYTAGWALVSSQSTISHNFGSRPTIVGISPSGTDTFGYALSYDDQEITVYLSIEGKHCVNWFAGGPSSGDELDFFVQPDGVEVVRDGSNRVYFSGQNGIYVYSGANTIIISSSTGAGGASDLSDLTIDTDKDWQGYSIHNMTSLSSQKISGGIIKGSYISSAGDIYAGDDIFVSDRVVFSENNDTFIDFGSDVIYVSVDNIYPISIRNDIIEIGSRMDTDFDIIGLNSKHPLFVDGALEQVGIRTDSPSYDLDVNGTIGATAVSSQKISGGSISGSSEHLHNFLQIGDNYHHPIGSDNLYQGITLKGDASHYISIGGYWYGSGQALHGGAVAGIYENTWITPKPNGLDFSAFYFGNQIAGEANIGSVVGLDVAMGSTSYTGTVNEWFGSKVLCNFQDGHFNNIYGLWVYPIVMLGGSATNIYGLKIAPCIHATNNWAIYTEQGLVHLGDDVEVLGTVSSQALSGGRIKSRDYISSQTGIYAHFVSANNTNLSTGGASNLSDLTIDGHKDWNNKGISNLNYISSQAISGGTIRTNEFILGGGQPSSQFHMKHSGGASFGVNTMTGSNRGFLNVELKDGDDTDFNQAIKMHAQKDGLASLFGFNGTAGGSNTLNVGLYGYAWGGDTNLGIWIDEGNAKFDDSVIIDGVLSSQSIMAGSYISTQTGIYAHFISANNSNLEGATESHNGWANVADGGTVAHSCSGKPNTVYITPSGTNPIMYSFTVDATNITVYHSAEGNADFSWRAEV